MITLLRKRNDVKSVIICGCGRGGTLFYSAHLRMECKENIATLNDDSCLCIQLKSLCCYGDQPWRNTAVFLELSSFLA